jgi:hypothetical protein
MEEKGLTEKRNTHIIIIGCSKKAREWQARKRK